MTTVRRSEVEHFISELGEIPVWTDPADMARYCSDWHRDVESSAVAVVRPGDTAEVAHVVRLCARHGLKVIPQGGNTGLVLGSLPEEPARSVIVSLERMNRIRSVDPDDFSAIVDAGCVLSEMKDRLAARGMFFPLTLGAQGSCQIGGNVSTNAGGVNVLRYGMTRELVLGLEVVLPDGSVWDGLSTLRKDNRGIDLKQLFIGAEGTLGIVTGVALRLSPLPTQVETALLALDSLEDAIALYRRARVECCDLMSAFEFLPPAAFEFARMALPDLPIAVAEDHPAYVLIELSGTGLADVADILVRFLEAAMADGTVIDGTVASSRTQAQSIWAIREGMNDGQALYGRHHRTDLSVPLSSMAAFVTEAESALAAELPDCRVLSYGHVGDGNVHINVLPARGLDTAAAEVRIGQAKTVLNRVLAGYGGSFSAEHGIGRLKRPEYEAGLSDASRALVTAIRGAIDPEGIMNPGCQISRSIAAPE